MSCFADSSALVKLYVPEDGHEQVSVLTEIVVSQLAKVEVTGAIWRYYRMQKITATHASKLVAAFNADYRGTGGETARFAAIEPSELVLDAAAGLTRVYGLRAYDAVQLATAVVVRSTEPQCRTFVAFDNDLCKAAVGEGFELLPGA